MHIPNQITLPTEGLEIALNDGLKCLAINYNHPLLMPFRESDRLSRGFLFSSLGILDWLGPRFKEDGIEPDIELSIRSRPYLNSTHVWSLLHYMESILPGIKISVPNDLGRIGAQAPLKDYVEIKIDRASLISAFALCQDQCFKKPYEKLTTWALMLAHAQHMAKNDKNALEIDSYLASDMALHELSETPFLPTPSIFNVFKNSYDQNAETGFVPGICGSDAAWALNKEDTRKLVVDLLCQLNINELAFFKAGIKSISLLPKESHPDSPRLVVISPARDGIPKSPFHLPAYHLERCENVLVRIMPKLSFEGREDAGAEMVSVLSRFDLSTADVSARKNVAYFSYTDEHSNRQKVPMIFDWDSGPYDMERQKVEDVILTDELTPWRNAHMHIFKYKSQAMSRSLP